jgi:hypothetical protein
MNVNRSVVASTLVIMAVGIAHAWTATPPQGITSVVLGGYVLMLILSVVDLFGGGLSQLASGLALLALVFALLVEGVPIVQQLGTNRFLQTTGSTTPATPAPKPGANPNSP